MEKVKSSILIIVLFFTLLVLSIPYIPAVEVNVTREEYESKINNFLSNTDKEIIDNIKNHFTEKKIDYEDLNEKINKLYSSENLDNKNMSTQSIVLLDIILIALFLYMVFKGIPNFFQNIYSVIIALANNISLIVKNIASLIFDIIVFSVDSLITLLLGIGEVILKILEFAGIGVFSIVAGLVSLIALVVYGVIYGVVKLVGVVWNGIETVLGLILDILRLIYEAIFPSVNTI